MNGVARRGSVELLHLRLRGDAPTLDGHERPHQRDPRHLGKPATPRALGGDRLRPSYTDSLFPDRSIRALHAPDVIRGLRRTCLEEVPDQVRDGFRLNSVGIPAISTSTASTVSLCAGVPNGTPRPS